MIAFPLGVQKFYFYSTASEQKELHLPEYEKTEKGQLC